MNVMSFFLLIISILVVLVSYYSARFFLYIKANADSDVPEGTFSLSDAKGTTHTCFAVLAAGFIAMLVVSVWWKPFVSNIALTSLLVALVVLYILSILSFSGQPAIFFTFETHHENGVVTEDDVLSTLRIALGGILATAVLMAYVQK